MLPVKKEFVCNLVKGKNNATCFKVASIIYLAAKVESKLFSKVLTVST